MGVELFSAIDFDKIKDIFPPDTQAVAGFPAKSGPGGEQDERFSDCQTWITAQDDHTIHKSVICTRAADDYEITEDNVVGFW